MLKKIGKFLLVLVVLGISMGLILYPFVSNYLFENRADGIIDTVEKQQMMRMKRNIKKK